MPLTRLRQSLKIRCRAASAASLLCAITLLLPDPSWAIGVIGKVRVKVDGYQGWHQLLDTDLEVKFSSLSGHTVKDGAFRIDDIGVFGRGLHPGSRVQLEDEDNNYVKFLVGRNRIVLPIDWEGTVQGSYLVLKPIRCEVLANGTGGCTTEDIDDPGYENRLRMQVGLPAIEAAPVRPKVVTPAEPVQPNRGFVERPSDMPVHQRALPEPPRQVQPVQPVQPVQRPKPKQKGADPELDLEIVEPM